MNKLLSTREAADYAGLSLSHIQYLLREGKIDGQRIGKVWVTTKDSVDKYLKTNPRPGPKKRDGDN